MEKYGVGDLTTREQVAGVIYKTLEMKDEGAIANPYKDISGSSTDFQKEILALTKRGVLKVIQMETLDRKRQLLELKWQ